MSGDELDRRDFLKAAAAAGLAASTSRALGQEAAPIGSATPSGKDPLARRTLGRTGFECTILGFGAFPISAVSEKQAIATIESALDEGINYFDTASSYGHHTSEGFLGKVLPRRKRESFFLTTKILERTREKAEKEFARSLEALEIAPDLVQLHAVNDEKTLDAVFAKGGSLEVALAAQKAGKCRFVGITGHTRPEVIEKALERHAFDTVLIPLGAPDWHVRSFEPVIAKANEKGAAVIGMKVLSGGAAPGKLALEPLYEYAFHLPIATAVIGAKSIDELRPAVAAARAFKPLSTERVAEIRELAKPLGTADALWWKRS